jgi:hypothetical protein
VLWNIYPEELDQFTLKEAYLTLEGDPPLKIPFLVRLIEDPDSLLSLPGRIDLYSHDCLHLLLKQGFTSTGEAYVVGFTMGNDLKTNWFHLLLFKLIARFLYPHPYRHSKEEFQIFDAGFARGRELQIKDLNQATFKGWQNITLPQLRKALGL